MGENILLVAVLLLALYGCTELIRHVAERLLTPSKACGGVLVIPLSGHHNDIEYIVRCAAARRRWGAEPATVLLIDNGMDAQTKALAEKVCSELGGVGIYEPREMETILDKGLQ